MLTRLAAALFAWSRETLYCITKKASIQPRQDKYPLYCPLHWLLSGKLDVSSLWMLDTATVSTVHINKSVAPGRNHVRTHAIVFFADDTHRRPWTKPILYVDTQVPELTRRDPKKVSSQTPESLRCHHFVTWSGDPLRCWPRLLQFNLRDQERQLPHHQKNKLNYWSSASSCFTVPTLFLLRSTRVMNTLSGIV
jgi:hypothetical protein